MTRTLIIAAATLALIGIAGAIVEGFGRVAQALEDEADAEWGRWL